MPSTAILNSNSDVRDPWFNYGLTKKKLAEVISKLTQFRTDISKIPGAFENNQQAFSNVLVDVKLAVDRLKLLELGLNSTFNVLYESKVEGPEMMVSPENMAKSDASGSQDGESMQEGKIPDSAFTLVGGGLDEEMGLRKSNVHLENISVSNVMTMNSNREMLRSQMRTDTGFLDIKKRINLIPLR